VSDTPSRATTKLARHVLLAAGVAITARDAAAQTPPTTPRWEAGVQVGFLPLYGGDVTVGSVYTTAVSGRVGYRLPGALSRTLVEAYLAGAAPDEDPYNPAPRLRAVGAAARIALRPPRARAVEPFAAVGVGQLTIDAREIDCDPATGCIDEGGPNFRDGTFTTALAGGGLMVPIARRAAVRVDLRALVPLGARANAGDSGRLRPEAAGGLTLRF